MEEKQFSFLKILIVLQNLAILDTMKLFVAQNWTHGTLIIIASSVSFLADIMYKIYVLCAVQ